MDVCAGLVSEMCCGSLIVWMCIIYILICDCDWCEVYVYAYLLYGMIVVSRSWSGVMNGELYVWMWM